MKRCLVFFFVMSLSVQLHAQQWTAIAPMHVARAESEAVQLHDGTILVVGGYASGVVEGSCEIYNPKTNTWNLTGSLSTPRFRFALNILPTGKVVALGGLTDLGRGTTNSCEVYDPVTGTWSTFGTLPEASENFPTCYLEDSTLVFLGGLDANTTRFLETSGEINPNSLAISSLPPMLIGNYSHFGQYLSSRRMIVAGGGDLGGVNGPYLRSTEVYDLNTQQWSLVDSLIDVCSDGNHHIVKLDDDRLVIPSGRSGPNTETLLVQIFDPTTLTWSAPGSLPREHFHCYSILVGEDSILTIGGATDPATTADIVGYTDWYNCRNNTSWEGPSMIDPRHVYSSLNLLLPVPGSSCADSEAIYVFGGETTGKVDINRCERLVLGLQFPAGLGLTTLTLPTSPQSTMQWECGGLDTALALGVTGCAASSAMVDSVWLDGSALFRVADARGTPRSLGGSDSIVVHYSGAVGPDTAHLHIRYDIGSGTRDTVIAVVGTVQPGLRPAFSLQASPAAVTQASCESAVASVRVGLLGCPPSRSLLDSVWLTGTSTFRITDSRKSPRTLLGTDSISISYLGTSGPDTALLHIRYDLGSGVRDTVIQVIGSLASPLLSEPEQLHREAASAYFGQVDSLTLGVDVRSSINLDSLWPYLTDIQGSYTWDTSVATYAGYLAPSGWTVTSLTSYDSSVSFGIHKLNGSVQQPLNLGTALFQPNGQQLATSWVELPRLTITVGGEPISLCVTDNEDNHWAVKTLGIPAGVAASPLPLSLLSEGFFLYPNPTEDILFLRNATAHSASIVLYDAIGRMVGTATADAASTASYDTHALTAGVYFARIASGGAMYSKVFVKK